MALCFLRLGNVSRDESKEVRSRKKGKGKKKKRKGLFLVFSLSNQLKQVSRLG